MKPNPTQAPLPVNRPRAVASGTIFGNVDCYVLEDGTTVLSQSGMIRGLLVGDNRETLSTLEDGAYQALFTSPPYFGLRLYGDAGEEIGKERALDTYVASIVGVMRECRRVLRDDGVAWVNLGDSYASTPAGNPGDDSKSTLGGGRGGGVNASQRGDTSHCAPQGNTLLVPFRVATALQADGWTLRAMLPWVKASAMPESVQSRPSIAHEYVLFLTKKPSGYFYDADAVRVGWADERAGFSGAKSSKFSDPGAMRNDGGIVGKSSHAGRSYRSSDVWRAGAREAAEQLLAAADGTATGLLTNDDAPAALVVNPKGSGIPHFAMWPTRLVAPMVLASTPEAGCCSACGAPWRRVVERGEREVHPVRRGTAPPRMQAAAQGVYHYDPVKGQESGLGMSRSVRTLGFAPSCACDAPTRPARILDPFAGAGTTLAVAEALGREATGCELYQKNADLYPERRAIVAKEVAKYLAERAAITPSAPATQVAAPPPAGGPKQLDIFGGHAA